MGALVAWVFNSNLGNKFKMRVREGRVSEVDKTKMVSLAYCTVYIIGCVLVAIPGLITDFIGLLLLLSPIIILRASMKRRFLGFIQATSKFS